jgi:hypothetical protein
VTTEQEFEFASGALLVLDVTDVLVVDAALDEIVEEQEPAGTATTTRQLPVAASSDSRC